MFTAGFQANGGTASTYMNMLYNILRPPSYMQQALPARSKIAGTFDSQSVTIQVGLNTELTVGEGFVIETLAPSGDTEKPVRDDLAGPLIASEIRHDVNLSRKRMQGQSIIKGVKGGIT
jgi:hypothetical protein